MNYIMLVFIKRLTNLLLCLTIEIVFNGLNKFFYCILKCRIGRKMTFAYGLSIYTTHLLEGKLRIHHRIEVE